MGELIRFTYTILMKCESDFSRGKSLLETVAENLPQSQNLAINKKNHNWCPIFMKLGENNHLMSAFGC